MTTWTEQMRAFLDRREQERNGHIVQPERIEPEFRELLMQKGRIVYER
ncbi:MAG: hypothetical protein ACOCYB_11840 [Alkalispirochaeta sp.]